MSWTYGDSERLDRARRRKQRDQRVMLGLLVGFVLFVAVGGWWLATSSVPEPPRVSIAWPSPAKFGKRTFIPVAVPGSTENYFVAALAIRKGQPFTVSVEDAGNWVVSGVTEETKEKSSTIHWSPLANGASLKIYCQPVPYGVQKLVAWMWPTYMLRVQGFVPQPLPDGRLSLKLEEPHIAQTVLISENTSLKSGQGVASWDDRVVPLLEAINKANPVTVVRPAAEPANVPTRWHVVEGYEGKRAPNDGATYFALNGLTGQVEEDTNQVTRFARFFAGREPKATIKFIVDENEPVSAVFRVIFDNKGARGGWIKRWEAENWSQLCQKILQEFDAHVVLLGGPSDLALNDKVAAAVQAATGDAVASRLTNIAGLTTLRELPALLAACTMAAGGDTGPMHIAAAVGTRTLLLFGPSDPRLVAPLQSTARYLWKQVECSPCYTPERVMDKNNFVGNVFGCHTGTHACLKTLTVVEVFDALRPWLEDPEGTGDVRITSG